LFDQFTVKTESDKQKKVKGKKTRKNPGKDAKPQLYFLDGSKDTTTFKNYQEEEEEPESQEQADK